MKLLKLEDRGNYKVNQIKASTLKKDYCKFSIKDAEKYIRIIMEDMKKNGRESNLGPILSLGVRNGREVNCFRAVLNSSFLTNIIRMFERRKYGITSFFPFCENLNRSNVNEISHASSIGVEINPIFKRSDIWIGSFDQLPTDMNNRFNIVYSNSFDHAINPEKTAEQWIKCLKNGGYMILAFPDDQSPTELDPVGNLSIEDVLNFFPGELIYYRRYGSEWKYTEYIIKI